METHLEEIDSLNTLNERLNQANRELTSDARTLKPNKDYSECDYLRKLNSQLNERITLLESEIKTMSSQSDSRDINSDSYFKKIVDEVYA